ncbi:MAG: thymidine phosphorylase [Candidatus Pacearchaeota archaeon]
MKLKVKVLNLSAGRPIAILHKDTAEQLQVQEDSRIKLRKFHKKSKKKWITAVVNIAVAILKRDEVALTQDIVKALKLKNGDFVEILAELRPHSILSIYKKMHGKKLNFTEIYSIISDISKGRLTESEIAYFVSAVYYKGLDFEETLNLTKAMVKTGNVLKHPYKYVLDLHSCGGVAGNRTSPIVVSLIASAIDYLKLDAAIPKTASRAITSAAGTADVMETVAKVVFTVDQLKKIIEKTRACLVWNSALELSPADDKIVKIESLVSIDAEPQLLASVISKKIADGATHVLIEIPYGESSKFNFKEAVNLKRKFLKLASKFGLKMRVVLTKGNEPIGRGIGPVLEMLDVLAVLKNEKGKPIDLENKSLMLASELLSLIGINKKEALSLCKLLLYSGRAYQKFKEIVIAQGGKINFEDNLQVGKYKTDIKSEKAGEVKGIDNKKIALIAKMAGCPGDKGAGIYLHKKIHDKVKENETLFTIYSESIEKLNHAKRIAKQIKPFKIE